MIMDKVDTLVDALRKECQAKYTGSASLEAMEGRLMSKFPDFERQIQSTKEDVIGLKNQQSAYAWDINDTKAQMFDIKNTTSDMLSKLDKLSEQAEGHDYEDEIEGM